MNIYCAIDGTENNDPTQLPPLCAPVEGAIALGSGHVKSMGLIGFHSMKYFAGTRDAVTGASSEDIVNNAYHWILGALDTNPDAKLFLGGFSRGGAAAIVVAHKLKADGKNVQEMFLFDAVDRSFWMDNDKTKVIPSNVRAAFHAVRHPASKSRVTFGNCGMQGTNGNLGIEYFMTTHGGVGGWPNGAARVKPGFGAEDFAYVARHGAFVGPYVAKSDPDQKNIHERGEPYPSKISVAQETRGQHAALRWMYGKALTTLARV